MGGNDKFLSYYRVSRLYLLLLEFILKSVIFTIFNFRGCIIWESI